MLLTHPLDVVTPTVDGDVLQVLAGADSAFTVGELHRLIGEHSYNGVRKAVLRLVDQGIVSVEAVGNTSTYRLNRAHLAADAIIELADLHGRFLTRLRETLTSWTHPPAFAALFGSAARGDMQAGSDIDVFVVRPDNVSGDPEALEADPEAEAWARDVTRLQQDAAAWTGNDTRVLEMSEQEVRAGLATQDPVLTSVRTEGLALLGTPGFWRKASRG